MNKSQFFEMVKSLKSKPDAVVLVMNSLYVSSDSKYMKEFMSCKTEAKAAKEFDKFNRWLSEALDNISPSETSWRPETKDFEIPNGGYPTGGLIERSVKIEPGYHSATVKSVDVENGKITLSAEVGDSVLKMPVRTYPVDLTAAPAKKGGKTVLLNQIMGRLSRIKKKQKSPEKMYIRATVKILKQYDCFDSAKNPHWSNMSKKQKKQWARNFALDILEANTYEMAHDLCVDGILDFNEAYELQYKDRARQQIIDELDAAEVEGMIEENLNCLW